jgi:anti-sigma B factor antagonist
VVVVMPPFSVREVPDAVVISIDEATALSDFRSNTFRDALYQAVETESPPEVALDLTRVDFLSSSGVAILVGLKRRVETRHGRLVLFGVQPVVQELLRITRLTQFFLFADDEAGALASLRSLPSN